MSIFRRFCFVLFLSGLVGVLSAGSVAAQPTHGGITTVSGQTLHVRLDDSLSVDPGTVGRVVEQRTVGGDPVQMSFAVVTVSRLEQSFDGAWTAICQIDRQSEDLEVDDRVQFESVFSRPRLSVRTTPPNVTVLLDSVEVGTTPLEGPVGVGRHDLRLERDGYRSKTRSLTLEAGERREIRDTLQTARGTLVVNTLPDSATVQLDDRILGTTPVSTNVQAGTYEVRLEREGFLPAERTVTVPSGSEQRLNVSLRRPLRVELASQQPDAVVNTQLTREGDRLVLEYDLVGDAEAYAVELELSTNGGQTFEPLPETVAGAVGDEIPAGQGKQIVWAATDDFPEGLLGSENRLRVSVEPTGGNSLYWVLGSTLAAGASATAAAVLGVFGGSSGGDGGGGPGGSGESGLPTSPPTPPN